MLQTHTTFTHPNELSATTAPGGQRLLSIDVLRAMTMVLMIFVNDLWTLTNIPVWLLHTTAEQDGMGLSDAIFPAFLFIVGMSIPLALDNRRKKGDSQAQVLAHVVVRGVALLVMGLFLVNGESLNAAATGMPRLLYNVVVCTSFILIWNAYPATANKTWTMAARILGILTLAVMAFVVRVGRDAETFSVFWWGILGLIGWCYLICALVYAFTGARLKYLVPVWVALLAVSMMAMEEIVSFGPAAKVLEPIGNGSLPFLTMGGVVVSVLFRDLRNRWPVGKILGLLSGIAVLLFIFGFFTNRFWIIAKLGATPPWVLICSGITLISFVVICWLVDVKGKGGWFGFIKPAGTSTLLTYLLPHYAYAIVAFTGITWPSFMLTGATGLVKCGAFALLCVFAAGWLGKRNVRLRL